MFCCCCNINYKYELRDIFKCLNKLSFDSIQYIANKYYNSIITKNDYRDQMFDINVRHKCST